jgi:hypothetical protein
MIIKHSTGSIDYVYDKNEKKWIKKESKLENGKDIEKPEKTENEKSEKKDS